MQAATKKEFQKGLVTLKLALKVSCHIHIDIACTKSVWIYVTVLLVRLTYYSAMFDS